MEESSKEILKEYGIVTVIDKFVKDEEAVETISEYINNLIDSGSNLKQQLESANRREKILFNLKSKYYEELQETKKLTDKLSYEAARTQDLVYAYARKNSLTDFRDRWEQKLYTDEDYTLYNLVGELIENIDQNRKG